MRGAGAHPVLHLNHMPAGILVGALRIAATSETYADGVRATIFAGGDICTRAHLVRVRVPCRDDPCC